MSPFFEYATRKECVFRAVKVALFIGTLLNIINHWDTVYYGNLTRGKISQMLITYLVPYCVSTYSSAMQAMSSEQSKKEF